MALDVVAVSMASVVAHVLRFGLTPGEVLPGPGIPYVVIALASVPAWLLVLWAAGAYDRRILGVGSEEYRRVLNGGVHCLAVVAVLHFVVKLVFARGWVGVMIPCAIVLIVLERYGLRRWLYHQRSRGRFVHRILLVGSVPTVVDVGEHLARASWSGYRVVGACVPVPDGDEDHVDIAGRRVPIVGSSADVRRALVACSADAVAITDESAPNELHELAEVIDLAAATGANGSNGNGNGQATVATAPSDSEWGGLRQVEVLVAPAITDVAGPRTVVRPAAGVPLLHVAEPAFAGPQRVVKEAIDRVAATIGLLAFAPFFLVIAIAIKLDSQGPIFFKQPRIGLGGRTFEIVKLRTMVRGAERMQVGLNERNEADGLLFKLRLDPRVTRVGSWLRRWSIDELPQLLNVLRGEMSLVGPRPPLPNEVEQYEHHVNRRLMVKPGMTGLWQVSGRSDLEWDEAVRLDLYYVDHWSPTMDFAIICRTFSAVARGSGAY